MPAIDPKKYHSQLMKTTSPILVGIVQRSCKGEQEPL